MELSKLPGKPVLSPAGEALGYVKCAYVCKNFDKLSCLACVDGEEEEFFVPAQAIAGVGDAVIASARSKTPVGIPSPIGKGVYDRFGNFLGGAGEFDPDNKLLFVYKNGGCAVFPAETIAVDEAIIVYENAKQKPAARRKNVQKNTKRTVKKETEAPPSPPRAENTVHKYLMPSRPLSGTNLLGKQVKKTVFSEEGTLASAGETVTPAVLKKAREHNRLVELAANTLTE